MVVGEQDWDGSGRNMRITCKNHANSQDNEA